MSPAAIPETLRQAILAEGHWRCGYCLSAEILTGIPLTLDHLIPLAAGGPLGDETLWLITDADRSATTLLTPGDY